VLDLLARKVFAALAAAIERRHIQTYLKYLRESPSEKTGQPLSPTTVDIRFRTLRAFFAWAVKDKWLNASPMAGLERPKVPADPKPHFAVEELGALLATCKNNDYDSVRDQAVMRFLVGTGARLQEVADVLVDNVDLKNRTARIYGKTGGRVVRLDPKAAAAMHRFLLLRKQHPHAADPHVWLGQKGHLSRGGIHLMLQRRGLQAGISKVNAHKFRHSYAHYWRKDGGSVVDLEVLMGWSPNSPMSRYYGASALADVALEHADQFGIGGRI
jgi:site-specific recombinase XerD